jgi:hypothetical protein
MKKVVQVCIALMFLSIAAGVFMLSRAGALRLMREPKEGAAVQPAAPAPATVPAPAPAPGEQTAAKPEPAKTASAKAESTPSVQPGTRVYTLDFERIMKDSAPGKAVNAYAEKYAAVMAKNVTLLNAALANKKKKYDVPQVKKLIAQYTKQKSDVWTEARSIVREMLRAAVAESPLKDALLIEKDKAFYLPAGLDRTDELIGYINVLTLDLPAPPKPVRIE